MSFLHVATLYTGLGGGADRFPRAGMQAGATLGSLSGLRDNFKRNVVVISISCVCHATLSVCMGCMYTHNIR